VQSSSSPFPSPGNHSNPGSKNQTLSPSDPSFPGVTILAESYVGALPAFEFRTKRHPRDTYGAKNVAGDGRRVSRVADKYDGATSFAPPHLPAVGRSMFGVASSQTGARGTFVPRDDDAFEFKIHFWRERTVSSARGLQRRPS
jgi:hypothetical protein